MDFLLKYKGLLRTVGGALGGVGAVLAAIPEPKTMAIGALLIKAGSILGGLGVVRAVARNVVG